MTPGWNRKEFLATRGTEDTKKRKRGKFHSLVENNIVGRNALDPEGIADGSRWSERSEDHRLVGEWRIDPGGVAAAPISATPPGSLTVGGVVGWSPRTATTGYLL